MDALHQAMDGFAGPAAPNFPQILDQCLASGIVGIDANGRIIAFSPEAAKLIGLAPVEALTKSAEILPVPLWEVLKRTLTTGETVLDGQILFLNASGAEQVVRVVATPIASAERNPAGAIAVLNNVTPARRLDENLRRMDRLASIGTLSASMAHEVKNAMVAVKTFVDLLLKKNQDAPLADIVVREMRRIDSIVSQLLRFSGPAKPTFALIQLHQVIEHALGLVQHHLEGRKIRLVRSLQASPDSLRGDAYQLEQVFLNLFFNALEAMGPEGELRVSTELRRAPESATPDPLHLRVLVEDTGIGIAPENLERLFDPFFTTKPNGTGLGLPITRRIVQEHRGTITVESRLHHGTTFILSLPSAARQP